MKRREKGGRKKQSDADGMSTRAALRHRPIVAGRLHHHAAAEDQAGPVLRATAIVLVSIRRAACTGAGRIVVVIMLAVQERVVIAQLVAFGRQIDEETVGIVADGGVALHDVVDGLL